MKARYYTFYVRDSEIISFLDGFKDRKENRNRFIIDLLCVAKQYQNEMKKALGSVEPQSLEVGRLREPEKLEQSQIIQAMDDSLQSWKEHKSK